jgi:hypothetical protein
MGMDVMGNEPKSEVGKYFRNNVWYWRPLWNYCCEVAPDIIGEELADIGHFNDGAGLDAAQAEQLGNRLIAEFVSGQTEEAKRKYDLEISEIPLVDCTYCETTGIRTDGVGESMGMPTKELSEDKAIILGRTHGTCNACDGLGKREHYATSYPFDVDNVVEFARFCIDSGGFAIY